MNKSPFCKSEQILLILWRLFRRLPGMKAWVGLNQFPALRTCAVNKTPKTIIHSLQKQSFLVTSHHYFVKQAGKFVPTPQCRISNITLQFWSSFRQLGHYVLSFSISHRTPAGNFSFRSITTNTKLSIRIIFANAFTWRFHRVTLGSVQTAWV